MSIKNPYEEMRSIAGFDFKANGFNEGVKAAVQYLEGKCGHRYYDPSWGYREFKNRFDCSDCRAKVHEELGI